ncbi:MAG TPA: ATP-binding protein [Gemmatimonadaceae bacterium]|nr:ATP-binding protein [Gemmatimonadaceae bacterium]
MLVVVALVGSVAIPARQTWLITKLLRETTDVLSPARLLQAELQSGLAEEIGALRRYALSGDTTALARYRVTARRDDERMRDLETLVDRLQSPAAAHVSTIRQRIDTWRQASGWPLDRAESPAAVSAAVETGQAQYDAFLIAIADLSADFVAEASARDARVRSLEHLSLMWNFALVLAAFGALTSVMILSGRERRLAALLRTRVEEESARARREVALREAAEALAGAFTADEVTQRIARSALAVVEGRGAFVEWISRRAGVADSLSVRATAGTGAPPLASSCDFAGSYTELVTASGTPELVMNLAQTDAGLRSTFTAGQAAAIVVPLGSPGSMVGALFVLGSGHHLRSEDAARAAILGHLASLAYEKVRLLDEEIEGRRRLERVISSRSRLMRGFSHDVKNPIGAADGYAELLGGGVYGELNARQQESIGRMRRCIHGALGLIDDLHELARAETGHLALSAEPVDLSDLLRDVGEEYQAKARSRRLLLTVDIEKDPLLVRTSRTRVRQILANLLSNAIKYTDDGSVTVRAARSSVGPVGDGGDWVLIEVADTGRGIPSDKLDFIFEEFGRVGDSDQTGAGLGLAISRLLAHALGGQITVSSQLGSGSCFTLWMPLVPGPAEAAGSEPRDRPQEAAV